MLSTTLFRVPRQSGLHPIQRRGQQGAQELSSWRLLLAPGQQEEYECADEETVLVLQDGAGRFETSAGVWDASRRNVFDERATAVYLPPATPLVVTAMQRLEAILIATPASRRGGPALVGPADVRTGARGTGAYAREVHDIFVDDPHTERLIVGETFTPPGNWSSFPPHKHDGRDGEPRLEEVYHFRIDQAGGFGVQVLYAPPAETAAHMVQDGDTVLLPYGYHPVAAPPGYRMYYLWALAGEQRQLAVFEDPRHRWIHE